ncbi:MAG: hypothetical protein AAF809_03760 [Bacteroidota bacterium]
MTISPWIGFGCVASALVLVLGGLRWGQQHANVSPEAARKGAHVTMGAVALLLPVLFDAVWPVVVLAVVSVGAMAALRWVGPLRRLAGGVLHDVDRQGYGELCFPVAVLLLYIGSGGGGPSYVIPLLLLAVADATAALVGLRFGRARFAIPGGTKSVEGSLAFFAVAVPCVLLPLLGAGLPWSLALGAALLTSLGAAFVEALSGRGLDNLFVPLYGLVAVRPFSAPDTGLPLAWVLSSLP